MNMLWLLIACAQDDAPQRAIRITGPMDGDEFHRGDEVHVFVELDAFDASREDGLELHWDSEEGEHSKEYELCEASDMSDTADVVGNTKITMTLHGEDGDVSDSITVHVH
jgi:hypothetical protein